MGVEGLKGEKKRDKSIFSEMYLLFTDEKMRCAYLSDHLPHLFIDSILSKCSTNLHRSDVLRFRGYSLSDLCYRFGGCTHQIRWHFPKRTPLSALLTIEICEDIRKT